MERASRTSIFPGEAGREELPPARCLLIFLRPPWWQNKRRLAAWLCAESAWRESFISTIATLCCKFSFAESGSSFPEKWELRLGTPQLTWVPSAFLLLKYNVLCLIKISTSLTASLNCCPVSYSGFPGHRHFGVWKSPCLLGSVLPRTIVLREADAGCKYSVKKSAFAPVAVWKRSWFDSKTSFWQLCVQFFKHVLLLICI